MTSFVAQRWKDITLFCVNASKEMTDEHPLTSTIEFSLFDSMSAVELMDPKMDQSCVIDSKITISELMGDVVEYSSGLSFSTASALLNSLIVNEALFLDGSSIMESVHQCIFMWKESWGHLESNNNVACRIIAQYCKSLSKSLSSVFIGVLAADVFEDEDFQSGHRQHLWNDLSDGVCSADCVTLFTGYLDIDGPPAEGSSEVAMLRCQLRYRRAMQVMQEALAQWTHSAVTKYSQAMRLRQAKHAAALAGTTVLSEEEVWSGESLSAIKNLTGEVLATLKQLQAQIDSLSNVAELDAQCSESGALQFAYKPALAKMAQTSAVRHVPTKSTAESLSSLNAMCEHILRVCDLASDLHARRATLTADELLSLMAEMSESRLHIVARSLLMAVMYTLSPSLTQMLQLSMSRYGLPNAIVLSDLVAQQWLPGNPCSALWDNVKALCVNRNTIVTRMENVLATWGAVATEAMYIDEQFKRDNGIAEGPSWCSTWCTIVTGQAMDLHLGLMVELEVLGQQELDYFFWYWDFVCTSRGFAMERLRELRQDLDHQIYLGAVERRKTQVLALEQEAKQRTGKGKKKGAESAAQPPVVDQPVPRHLSVDEYLCKGRGQLCRGVFRMLIVANQLGLVDKTENRFMSWECRFSLRFKAFRNIPQPPLLSYTDFLKTLLKGSRGGDSEVFDDTGEVRDSSKVGEAAAKVKIDAHAVVSGASVCFQNARKYLDEVRRMPASFASDKQAQNRALQLTKVAVASSVSALRAAQLVGKQQQDFPPCRLKVSASYDPQFPVVEIAAVV